jgi:hypothetical protein
MHLRENHIIPEIIDENGNVLPDGEYGELVLTTIGAEAMPLIRYRTGDYTRILPPCKCGGVTKRIDTASRREGVLSMEKLDSTLFAIPELVDYRASLDGALRLTCLSQDLSVTEKICAAVKTVDPCLQVIVEVVPVGGTHRPLYLGKRHIVQQ